MRPPNPVKLGVAFEFDVVVTHQTFSHTKPDTVTAALISGLAGDQSVGGPDHQVDPSIAGINAAGTSQTNCVTR